MRVDPHLVSLAIKDMVALNRLRVHRHPSTKSTPWYSNRLTDDDAVKLRLEELAPLYATITASSFTNLVGDALEIIVFQALKQKFTSQPRHAFHGDFALDQPKNNGRFKKTEPPHHIATSKTLKSPDFIQYGYDCGPLCIECKNYREWLYPHDSNIKQLIITAYELRAVPVLIARRLHYTTRTNLLEPAGIMAHETYYQYYPSEHKTLADKARHKRSLGFTDILATEEPHPRTVRFISSIVPKISSVMAERWTEHRSALYAYANNEMNLAQLYNAIGSPAGGKWQDYED